MQRAKKSDGFDDREVNKSAGGCMFTKSNTPVTKIYNGRLSKYVVLCWPQTTGAFHPSIHPSILFANDAASPLQQLIVDLLSGDETTTCALTS